MDMRSKIVILIATLTTSTPICRAQNSQINSTPEQQEAARQWMLDAQKKAPLWDRIIMLFDPAEALKGLSVKGVSETVAQGIIKKAAESAGNESIKELAEKPMPVSTFMNNVVKASDMFDALGAKGYATPIDGAGQSIKNKPKFIEDNETKEKCP